jgi:hypothetical protein
VPGQHQGGIRKIIGHEETRLATPPGSAMKVAMEEGNGTWPRKAVDNWFVPGRDYAGEDHTDRTSDNTSGNAPQAWAAGAG